jgi:putative DeoR family transcriptional regulator (stage III sporulation protein D)
MNIVSLSGTARSTRPPAVRFVESDKQKTAEVKVDKHHPDEMVKGGAYLYNRLVQIKARACEVARYIIETGCTVRQAAQHFEISKSTVHHDLTIHLPKVDELLYNQVSKVLAFNCSQRHIRGGEATKRVYASRRLR